MATLNQRIEKARIALQEYRRPTITSIPGALDRADILADATLELIEIRPNLPEIQRLLGLYRLAVRRTHAQEDHGTHGDGKLKEAQRAEARIRRQLESAIR